MTTAQKILSSLLITGTLASAQTLAMVNGTPITQEDVNSALMQATQGRLAQIPADKQQQFRQQVLQQLIQRELVFEDAKKSGILKSPEFKSEFQKIQEKIKKDLAIQLWQKKQLQNIKVSEKELRDYYNKNKQQFHQPEMVHARHILVKTKEEAQQIIDILKSTPKNLIKEKFIALARSKSTGPSAKNGGDLGYFAQGQMVPAFNDKVFSMKVGTITQEPVKTQFGYHVIYLEDKKPATTRSFNAIKPFIEQRLKMEKFQKIIAQKIQELQKKANIKY